MCTQRVQLHTFVQHASKTPNTFFRSRGNMITQHYLPSAGTGTRTQLVADSPSVEGVGVGKPNAGLNTLRATSCRKTTRPRDVGAILYKRKSRTSLTWTLSTDRQLPVTSAERADSSAPSEDAASWFSTPPADLSEKQPPSARSSRPLLELLTSCWC